MEDGLRKGTRTRTLCLSFLFLGSLCGHASELRRFRVLGRRQRFRWLRGGVLDYSKFDSIKSEDDSEPVRSSLGLGDDLERLVTKLDPKQLNAFAENPWVQKAMADPGLMQKLLAKDSDLRAAIDDPKFCSFLKHTALSDKGQQNMTEFLSAKVKEREKLLEKGRKYAQGIVNGSKTIDQIDNKTKAIAYSRDTRQMEREEIDSIIAKIDDRNYTEDTSYLRKNKALRPFNHSSSFKSKLNLDTIID